jgi:hypothetical protein
MKKLLITLGILLLSVWAFVVSYRGTSAQFQLPTFTSAVSGVQIISAEVNQETNELEVTVQNATPKTVIGIYLSCGNGTNGLVDTNGNPLILPYSTLVRPFPIGNLQVGKPLSVSAVLWSDGTSEGYPKQAAHIKKGISQ